MIKISYNTKNSSFTEQANFYQNSRSRILCILRISFVVFDLVLCRLWGEVCLWCCSSCRYERI